jgi:hypothetical protein
MPKIKNVSPYGDLDVPLLGVTVARGEEVDVKAEHAKILLEQEDNWQPSKKGGETK